MASISDRLASLEAAVSQLVMGSITITTVSGGSEDTSGLYGMDVQQNQRLAAVEQSVATQATAISALQTRLTSLEAEAATFEAQIADLTARVVILEAKPGAGTNYVRGIGDSLASLAEAIGTLVQGHHPTRQIGDSLGSLAESLGATVIGGSSGTSTTHALPYTLGT